MAKRASNTTSRTRTSNFLAQRGRTHFSYCVSCYNEQLPRPTWPDTLPILRLVLERATSRPNVAERASDTTSRSRTSSFLAQRGRAHLQRYVSHYIEPLPGPTWPNALPTPRPVLERATSLRNVAEHTGPTWPKRQDSCCPCLWAGSQRLSREALAGATWLEAQRRLWDGGLAQTPR